MRSTLLNLFCSSTLIALGWSAAPAAFDSGSNRTDGALTFTADLDSTETVILFDPASFAPPLDADGDGVYHFTSITIPAGVTVRLRADKCGMLPIHWLAAEDVIIAGNLDLSGTDAPSVPFGTLPPISIPGPGGFPGGLGETPTQPAQPGFGPGGGLAPYDGGSFASLGYSFTTPGPTYGNAYLMPLVGGSGGTGTQNADGFVTSGGAGGGAILIASNTSITLNGTIRSLGGQSGATGTQRVGGGSGGAVRLMAPGFTGSGGVDVVPSGEGNPYYGGAGWIRVESTNNSFRGTFDGVLRNTTLFDASPTGAFDPRTKITVTFVGSFPVLGLPGGSFTVPDVVINSGSVSITARVNNPPATGVRYVFYLFNESQFQILNGFETLPGPIVGGVQEVRSTTGNIPSGFTRGFVAMVPNP